MERERETETETDRQTDRQTERKEPVFLRPVNCDCYIRTEREREGGKERETEGGRERERGNQITRQGVCVCVCGVGGRGWGGEGGGGGGERVKQVQEWNFERKQMISLSK